MTKETKPAASTTKKPAPAKPASNPDLGTLRSFPGVDLYVKG